MIEGSRSAAEQSLGQSGRSARQPDPSGGQPDPSGGQPNRSARQSGQSAGQPDQLAGQHEPSAGQPDPSAKQPNQSARQSGQSAEQPDQLTEQPEPSAGQPGQSPGRSSTPGLDVPQFETWLRRTHPDLAGSGPLSATLMTGGRSNVTYGIKGATQPMVLRRPPLGHVQATAHDMAREHRVISALTNTTIPVPRALALNPTPDASTGLNSPFYLMTWMPGHVLGRPNHNDGHTRDELRVISFELTRLLAELHRLDPADAGLSDFGRPEGYLERQLHRWGLQYDGSRSRELPRLDLLQERLRERVPKTVRSGLVHGDFRLDNALVHQDLAAHPSPISAILDWELSSLGDTAVDVGLLGLYWELQSISPGASVSAIDPAAGYPSFAELLDTYCEVLGTRVAHLSWYRAFAAYKLAVILEGVYFRHQSGGTVGTGFGSIGDLAQPLAEHGLAHLSGSTES